MPTKSSKVQFSELLSYFGIESVLDKNSTITDEEVFACMCMVESSRYLINRRNIPKSLDWWTNTVSQYDDDLFKTQFRMNRNTFYALVKYLEDKLISTSQDPIALQLGVTLYRLGTYGNAASVRHVASRFGVGQGSVPKFTDRIIKALVSCTQEWIRWPASTERKTIGDGMASKYFPQCIGFVDGTDVVFCDAPVQDKEVYWSRKKRYSMQVQIVCDPKKVIRDLFLGYPGSVHDAKVYTSSPLGIFPEKFFSPGEYIIGDSAYPISETVIVPYRKTPSGLHSSKKKFNYALSGERVAVEHCIGILKSRFQSLRNIRIRVTKESGHKFVCDWVHACVVLHNMLLDKDPWNEEIEEEVIVPENNIFEGDTQFIKGNLKREALFEMFKLFHNIH